MASHKGNDGSIVVAGSGTVGEVKSFSIETSAGTAETTTMGSYAATHVPTITSWTASVDVLFDPADTDGQVALQVGIDEVAVKFQMNGTATGDTYYSGNALVTGHSRNSSYDGMIEASISLQGTGVLTTGTA
jgi:predicted secreted protein